MRGCVGINGIIYERNKVYLNLKIEHLHAQCKSCDFPLIEALNSLGCLSPEETWENLEFS